MSGDVHVRFSESLGVRFPRATRLVVGFQLQRDAERFLCELEDRLRKFKLELHADKTRLIEFGRFASADRKRGGRETTACEAEGDQARTSATYA